MFLGSSTALQLRFAVQLSQTLLIFPVFIVIAIPFMLQSYKLQKRIVFAIRAVISRVDVESGKEPSSLIAFLGLKRYSKLAT